jgi:hypothetical protein
MSNLMSRPWEARRGEGEAQGVGAEAGDAIGEFLARGLLDAGGLLGVHQAGGALGHQIVDADAVDQVDGVQHVALGFRHLVAVGIPHQAGDVDVPEGHLAGEVQGHHDHARHPEEDDVETGDQHAGGQVVLQFPGVFRPAQGGKGPQGRREPGVQHILVAADFPAAGLFLRFSLVPSHIDVAVLVVPGGDAVAPPELAGDAPVLDVLEPLAVGGGPVLRHEAQFAGIHHAQSLFRQAFHAHEPLVGEHGLDHRVGAVAARNLELVGLGGDQQATGLQFVQDFLACHVTVQALVFGRGQVVHLGVQGQDVDGGQLVALAHLPVVEIVGRGDLHHAGAEFPVHVVVGDDGDGPLGHRQANALADQVSVAFIGRVHRHGGVTQQGLGPGSGHGEVPTTILQGIADLPDEAVLLLAHHFQVGHGGLQHRVPVHQTLAAIDQALVVEAHEHLGDSGGQSLVHGEALPRPVRRGTQAAHLARDGGAGVLLPFPHLLQELLPAQVVAADLLGIQLPFHHDLRGDAGVVGAWLPQGVLAAHAVVTGQGIHQAMLEGMAHVQGAGDVGGGQQDAVERLALLPAHAVIAGAFPMGIPAFFDFVGLEGFGEFHIAVLIKHETRNVAAPRLDGVNLAKLYGLGRLNRGSGHGCTSGSLPSSSRIALRTASSIRNC